MKHCPVCNKVVPQGHGHKSAQIYCSEKCYQERNIPPLDDLLTALNKNKNIVVTAELFGVQKQALYRWMDKYGIKRIVQFTT